MLVEVLFNRYNASLDYMTLRITSSEPMVLEKMQITRFGDWDHGRDLLKSANPLSVREGFKSGFLGEGSVKVAIYVCMLLLLFSVTEAQLGTSWLAGICTCTGKGRGYESP